MCLMKIDCALSDGRTIHIENVSRVDGDATGLTVETLLDGTQTLPGVRLSGLDCANGRILIESCAVGGSAHA